MHAAAGSTVNFGLMNLNDVRAQINNGNIQLVNLNNLNLQNLQFQDVSFGYQAEDPTKQKIYNPNDPRPFISLPGYCAGQGCQLMNL